MILKAIVLLSFAVAAIVAQGESDKKTKFTTTSTTPVYTTYIPTMPPPTSPIYPYCCAGPNEIYLPPRIAPYCQVYCKDIDKECEIKMNKPQPYGCYCEPGFCRGKDGKCILFSDAFSKCH